MTAVCLHRQATARQTPASTAFRRPAATTAAVIGRSMNSSNPAAWESAGKLAAVPARKNTPAATAAVRVPVLRLASDASRRAVPASTRAPTARTGRMSRSPVTVNTRAYT